MGGALSKPPPKILIQVVWNGPCAAESGKLPRWRPCAAEVGGPAFSTSAERRVHTDCFRFLTSHIDRDDDNVVSPQPHRTKTALAKAAQLLNPVPISAFLLASCSQSASWNPDTHSLLGLLLSVTATAL